MIAKNQLKLIMSLNLFHTMAHIYPYFLPILTQVIREDIVMNYVQIAVLSMTSTLVMIPLTIVIGFMGAKIHRWRMELIAVGYLLVLSHTFIIFAAPNYVILILAAVVGGIGASVFHPIALPLMSQEFGSNRNVALSINLIFGTIGSILTPVTSIYLSEMIGWRDTSLYFGVAGAILFPLMFILLMLAKKELHYKPQRAVMINKQVFILGQKGNRENNGKMIRNLLSATLIIVIFAIVIRSGIFRILNTFTALIFEDTFGATELQSALIMSLVLATGGISAFFSGFVGRRVGSLKTYIASGSSTTLAAIAIVIFTGVITLTNTTVSVGLLVIAILLFCALSITFYFGNSSSTALLAEIMPLEVLSPINGIVDSIMSSFTVILLVFGRIIDQGYTFPYEFILIILFSLVPLLMILYVKTKIGYNTPEQIEKNRELDAITCQEALTR